MARATGAIAECKHCERPYPAECATCPHCGEPTRFETRDTITSVEIDDAPSWTFRLIAEVIDRALASGRAPEAERMLERAARELDGRVRTGRKISSEQLAEAARFALRLSQLKRRPEWADWVIRLYRRQKLLPEGATLDLLEALDADSLRAVRPELEALLIDHATLALAHTGASAAHEERRLAALVQRATG